MHADRALGKLAEEESIHREEYDPEEDNEEFRALKITSRLYLPTKAKIDAHVPLHARYRSRCKFCMEGNGASRMHRTLQRRLLERLASTTAS